MKGLWHAVWEDAQTEIIKRMLCKTCKVHFWIPLGTLSCLMKWWKAPLWVLFLYSQQISWCYVDVDDVWLAHSNHVWVWDCELYEPKMTRQFHPPTGPHLLTGAENKPLSVSCGLNIWQQKHPLPSVSLNTKHSKEHSSVFVSHWIHSMMTGFGNPP